MYRCDSDDEWTKTKKYFFWEKLKLLSLLSKELHSTHIFMCFQTK